MMRRGHIAVPFLLVACASDPRSVADVSPVEDTMTTSEAPDYNVVFDTSVVSIDATRDEAIRTLPNLCSTFKHEYVGLYPIADTLPTISEDSTTFSSELRRRGFHNVHSGHGNWQNGPRMILVVLTNEACTCAVTKLYHIHGLPRADSTYAMRITERLFCNTEL